MNTRTGEITNDPDLIRKWRELGIPVVELPDWDKAEERYHTAPVREPVAAPVQRSGGRAFRRDPVTGLKLRA